MRVVYRPGFLSDLRDAYVWIALDSETAADNLLDRIEAVAEGLTRFPMMGARQEKLGPGLRSIRVRPFRHLVIYRVGEDEIDLIRLLHGARALEEQNYKP